MYIFYINSVIIKMGGIAVMQVTSIFPVMPYLFIPARLLLDWSFPEGGKLSEISLVYFDEWCAFF